MTRFSRYVPALVTLGAALWLVSQAVPPRDPSGGFRLEAFGRLPVVYQGRVKPFDTLARNSLVVVSDRQTWRDAGGRSRPAIEWLLDVMANRPRAADQAVFRIQNQELLAQLGLDRRPGYR
jgi:hypothetical protein